MSQVLLGFVGDVLVNREDPPEIFKEVREILRVPRILFGNLEGVYSDHPQPIPSAPSYVISPARNLDVYAEAGFNVVSMANNHIADAGYAAMLENRSRLRAQGVQTCGAGECLADAREPAILEADGLRIAFLAYASIFPLGCEARANTPGLAPMRAYNFWREPFPTSHLPGSRPLVTTVPDEDDLAHLTEDIRLAKARADLVITSFHWGDQMRPFVLTDHETRTARHCVDHGADMVIGHHHHALRGMEWYQGKPIMYGLGHFVFDFLWEWSEEAAAAFAQSKVGRYYRDIGYEAGPRKGWPLLPFPEDGRYTLLAWASATRQGIRDIGFLPCAIAPDGAVHPLVLGSPESNEVVGYFEKCNRSQELNGRVTAENARLIAGFHTLRVMPDGDGGFKGGI